jgi:thiol-disulfide isomerase/thioredoxin
MLVLSACGGESSYGLRLDMPAPAYRATSLAGDSVSLSRLAGRPVLLNIWATWCVPCREEVPYLVQLYDRYREAGLEIVGVSLDAPGAEQQIRDFAGEMSMDYPIWLDPGHRATSTFLAVGVPASYLVDRRGILRWRQVGVLRAGNAEFLEALDAALADTVR